MITFIYSIGILSLFLIIGVILRANLKIFQNIFVPASVIGGFLLLLLPLPKEYLDIYLKIPSILIVPIVASIPLGLPQIKNNREKLGRIMSHAFIMLGVTMIQVITGILGNIGMKKFIPNLYKTFGSELEFAFAGGHGSIGMLSSILKENKIEYLNISQGTGSVIATFGLVGGILLGMLIINIFVRFGQTKYINFSKDIPLSLKIGYEKDILKQNSAGRETTMSTSIDTLAFHMALILSVTAFSHYIYNFFRENKIIIFKDLAVWTYALIIMFVVWNIMCRLKLQCLVDSKIKSKISGMFTEFAIISAIGSMPIKLMSNYIIPIIILCIFGFLTTFLYIFILSKLFIKEDWFEHAIINFGMNTGVFITGLLLLRISDSKFESSALENHTLCYAFTAWSFVVVGIILNIWINKDIFKALIISTVLGIIFTACIPIFSKFKKA